MTIVSKLYNKTTGDDLFKLSEAAKEPLVEGILSRNDYIMIVAQAKVGKTLFLQQLTSNMTSGTPFLGVYDIPKPLVVWYFATEGRTDDLKERWIRIDKRNTLEKSNLILFKTFFKFNSPEGVQCLEEIIEDSGGAYPDVIVVDSLYSGFKGSLKDDESTNSFNGIMAQLIDKLDCAIIIVHHLKKPGKDDKGNEIRQSGSDSYGSAFFDASLDHKFHLAKWRGKDFPLDRVLTCKLQRSGKVIDNVRIRLHEPDPLWFQLVGKYADEKNRVLKILNSTVGGYCIDDIIKNANIGRSVAYCVLKELGNDGRINKETDKYRKVLYSLTGTA